MRDLQVFCAIMECGGVTQAAQRLRISQPAASKMLRQAEDRLGFQLFVREGKRLVPTAEAHALLPEWLGAAAALDGVSRLADALRKGRSGRLAIAAVPVLATALLPYVVQAFRTRQPGILVSLRACTALEAAHLVADHRADLAVILGQSADPRIERERLGTSTIGCVLHPGHPLVHRRRLSLLDLADQPVISLSPQQPVGALLRQAMALEPHMGQVVVEVSQSSIACALVRTGAGVAVLDGFGLLEARTQGLSVRPLQPVLPLEVCLLRPRHHAQSIPAALFTDLLRETAREALAEGHGRG
ncbi:LysR substrate-binding domain-containing protein [Teichococcus vastitatis]|uniref:LysR substrate-binding domain-containing protein n=1 Tax=Teichococcus vastitatis TaxID=2307076 RepID=A0ABS9W8K2_9PROT|nr:LysR substrate-binding domain-containing protein [Pseudoroseomonas vastitatis]MCI0755632.1 LysR substrate-binding domain-containing protein [Pseudoroseomonas vastitatis]